MDQTPPELSPEQWQFLAVLEALAGPVSVELACYLAPLSPGPLFDLLGKLEPPGWIEKVGHDHFTVGPGLPAEVRRKIHDLHQTGGLAVLVDRLAAAGWTGRIDHRVMVGLLEKAGRIKEASELEIELARKASGNQDFSGAQAALQRALARLSKTRLDVDSSPLFISGAIELSNLSFFLGRGFPELEDNLHLAQEAATLVGDRRSHALIGLHLGRWYYFSDRRMEALVAFSLGLTEVDELGDDDILAQASEFAGIDFFLQGRFKEALEHFERTEESSGFPDGSRLRNSTASLFTGYTTIYLGQFHRAIGFLDYHWWRAIERSDLTLATTLRAVLGTVLVLLKKTREAAVHLEGAQEEAIRDQNALGLYLARGGLALSHFMAGRIGQAYGILKLAAEEGSRAGLIRQFSSPWILEMLSEFHRLSFEEITEMDFPRLVERAREEPNVHLKGVVHRLLAQEKMAKGDSRESIASDLIQSEDCLKESGDPVQLAKTRLEMARLALRADDRAGASSRAYGAWQALGGYAEDFFPDEFKFLLEKRGLKSRRKETHQEFLERYLEMIEELLPGRDQRHVLNLVVTATSRLFGAERGALFWFPKGKYTPRPEMRAAGNLAEEDMAREGFRPYLDLVLKAFRQKQPIVVRAASPGPSTAPPPRSVLCIPIEAQGLIRGVLYLDNSYLNSAFDFVDLDTLRHMARHTNAIIERLFDYLKMKEEWQALTLEKTQRLEQLDREPMIARDSATIEVLALADKVAGSDSTVLILGETGTGKELLARRIHHQSPRRSGPLVIIDATTIPDNLIESELFGYEKGAFTGADQRKIGRVEQANGGTLFLDEVGELPLKAQGKLLRALQEKTFQRVGGTRTISADFRLIAATNRHLAAEVAAGRFRQDLYYRLNVVPLTVPPLRERQEDIAALARHFFEFYTRKYHLTNLTLEPEDERALREYPWPGNARELKNVIERAVIMSSGPQLNLHLPPELTPTQPDAFADQPTLDELQRRYIKYILERTSGRVGGPGGAAEILGLKRTSFYSRLKQLGMAMPR